MEHSRRVKTIFYNIHCAFRPSSLKSLLILLDDQLILYPGWWGLPNANLSGSWAEHSSSSKRLFRYRLSWHNYITYLTQKKGYNNVWINQTYTWVEREWLYATTMLIAAWAVYNEELKPFSLYYSKFPRTKIKDNESVYSWSIAVLHGNATTYSDNVYTLWQYLVLGIYGQLCHIIHQS
jgi:hypothetical protein